MTNASGLYPNNADEALTSTPHDFTALVSDPAISFQINLDTAATTDAVILEVSFDGTLFTAIESFQETTNGYVNESATITGAAGQNDVVLRFRLISDGSTTGEGVAIDDIKINGTVPIVAQSTVRASVGPNNEEADSDSLRGDVSGDGNLVVFESFANNLAPSATGEGAIFLRNINAETTTPVSVSITNGVADGFRPRITPSGRYVVFQSYAPNLVANGPMNEQHIYRRDLLHEHDASRDRSRHRPPG